MLKRLLLLLVSLFYTICGALVPPAPLDETGAVCRCGGYTLVYDTAHGTFSVAKNGSTLFQDAFCAYDRDGASVSSRDYTSFSAETRESGNEVTLSMRMQGEGLWDLTQTFTFSSDRDWFTTRVTLQSPQGVATNAVSPLIVTDGKLQPLRHLWTNVLEVPFDNDGWAAFSVKGLGKDTVSYEAGALFTPEDGGGLILGSLEHDHWKSAVLTKGTASGLQELRLTCGVVDPRQGAQPHGTRSGEIVSSALMLIGVFDNWQEGLNTFARANTAITPKRAAVTDSVPFGWNSWGSVQTALNYDTAVGTSDYIKETLQPVWGADGTPVYVNLDSYWDNLSAEELRQFVDHCHQNGQKVGLYTAPFVSWWDDYGMSVNYVPGTDQTVTYQDIRLKKADGSFYGNEVDGCIPLDVTHPATKLHVQNTVDRIKAAGVDYIKLDFLVHASFEGDFYDDRIQTGIEAYNYAMTYLTEMVGDDIFLNLAMSPIFPYQYANGRRLACDAFYHIGDTEYTLNAVTYGFWEKELYDYTDPDHIVIWGKDGDATEAEARSRITSGVIAGTSFLTGDNFVSPAGDAAKAFARYESLLTNEQILAVAKRGQIFLPVITNSRNRTANIYRLETADKTYLAVFNFDAIPRVFTVDTGLGNYRATELWRGRESVGRGLLTAALGAKDAALYEVTKR